MQNLTPAQATVIASIISGLVAVIVCLVNNRAVTNKQKIADAKRDAKLEMWMQAVDRKLDTHNGYAERFGEISTDIAEIKTAIQFLKEK
jgi:hypothetical protein